MTHPADETIMIDVKQIGGGWTMQPGEPDRQLRSTPADPTPEFDARCRAVLAIVQRDLEATGLGEYLMHPRNLRADGVSVEMFAALRVAGRE